MGHFLTTAFTTHRPCYLKLSHYRGTSRQNWYLAEHSSIVLRIVDEAKQTEKNDRATFEVVSSLGSNSPLLVAYKKYRLLAVYFFL